MEDVRRSYQQFEGKLELLKEKGKEGSLSLEDILLATSGKKKILLMMFFSMVYAQIPLFTPFFGVFMMYIGLRFCFSQTSIWLPPFLLKKNIPPKVALLGMNQILKFLKLCKKFTCPRYSNLLHHRFSQFIIAGIFFLMGLSLCIMPSIPGISLIAVMSLFFIGIGILNEDGLYFILGQVFSLFFFLFVVGAIWILGRS